MTISPPMTDSFKQLANSEEQKKSSGLTREQYMSLDWETRMRMGKEQTGKSDVTPEQQANIDQAQRELMGEEVEEGYRT